MNTRHAYRAALIGLTLTFCSLSACIESPSDEPETVSCEVGGQRYDIGETFSEDNGCNSCSCTETGEVVLGRDGLHALHICSAARGLASLRRRSRRCGTLVSLPHTRERDQSVSTHPWPPTCGGPRDLLDVVRVRVGKGVGSAHFGGWRLRWCRPPGLCARRRGRRRPLRGHEHEGLSAAEHSRR